MGNKIDTGGTSAPEASPATLDHQSRPLRAGASELLQDRNGGLPVWIRSPKTGTEYFAGFSRAKLYELAGKGVIRSVSIREPGQIKGTRLFNLQSILDFIAKCEQEGAAS